MRRRRTTPIRWEGSPEEQAQIIMSQIINQPPGQSPPSGQAPEPHRKHTQPTRGVRGQRSRVRSGGGRGGGGRGDTGGQGSRTPPQRKQDERQDRQEATESGSETEVEEDEGNDEEGDKDGETPRGELLEVVRVGGGVPPPEENADHPDFTPERAHLLLQGVYGDF